MVIKVEVTINGGSVTALARDADLFDKRGNIRSTLPLAIEGSRVEHGDLAWSPLSVIEPPNGIIEERAVAALLISMRAVSTPNPNS